MTEQSNTSRKRGRYERVRGQLEELLAVTAEPVARMATVAALLHGKMDGYFWTGFYRLIDGDLLVGPYQGPLACQRLERNRGVCWAAVQQNETIVVPDVLQFPGHIACDERSRSEIAVPCRDKAGQVWAVLDVDSREPGRFDADDTAGLEAICKPGALSFPFLHKKTATGSSTQNPTPQAPRRKDP